MFVIPVQIQAQASMPYAINLKKELPYMAIISAGTPFFIISQKNLKHSSQLPTNALSVANIPAIDRFSATMYSPSAIRANKYAAISIAGACISSAAYVAYTHRSQDYSFLHHAGSLAIMWAEVQSITLLASNITKNYTLRYRPYMYNSAVPADAKADTDGRRSFFSNHTTFAASNSFFMAHVWANYNPQLQKSAILWASAATLPAIVGTLSIISGKHFLTDVLVGYAVGAVGGCVIPQLHRQALHRTNTQLYISPSGIVFAYTL